MKWTKLELDFLKKNYPYLDDFTLSKELNRSIFAIRAKANRGMGLKKYKECLMCSKDITSLLNALRCKPCSEIRSKDMKFKLYLREAVKNGSKPKNLWTEADYEYLRENYSFIEDEILAKKLKRSIGAIKTKANKFLNLKKNKKCVECNLNLTGRSPTILRCDTCAIGSKKQYKKKWAEINKEGVKKRYSRWVMNNHARKKEMNKLWRIKNRARKLETDKLNYQRVRRLENERRQLLKLPVIGKGYSRELELLKYVRELFLGETILYRDREALDGYELDIFLPNLKIAFEYQGIQHFEFVKFFHGDLTGLKKQFARDIETKKRCKEKGIKLIEIFYYESLSEQLILTKLIEFGIVMCTMQPNLKYVITNHNLGGNKDEQAN
ncbi:MAG: hypothetical protein Q8R00_03595 [Candidatus Nanoarchaeia archaeon]|nr:hypothetical protein [Candidatus Nanoarchaeia archaeon]